METQGDLNIDFIARAASEYSISELVEIYNQSRVDYIVPMPMNVARMQEYVDTYDINLDASLVVCDPDDSVVAVSMLGVRDDRTWITRLGVMPVKRRRGTGQFIMDHHIETSMRLGAAQIQLEVIKNNTPAHQLFLRNDFQETRELLIVRRAPGEPDFPGDGYDAQVTSIHGDDIPYCLSDRTEDPAWTEHSASLLNGGNLAGVHVEFDDGANGYLIFQRTAFQLSHFVFSDSAYRDPELALCLLYHAHQQNPMADTKVENVPLHSPIWEVYQEAGYIEVFRRIEMVREL